MDGIFCSGWRGHDELPLDFVCQRLRRPLVNGPFGLVFLEAMSCGLPVITTAAGGPLSFVNTVPGKPNGWLVAPDDVDALADALVKAVNDAVPARNERADHAKQQIRGSYSWRALTGRFDALYTDLLERAAS